MLVNRVGNFGLAPEILGCFTLFQTVDFLMVAFSLYVATFPIACSYLIMQRRQLFQALIKLEETLLSIPYQVSSVVLC